MLYSCSAVVADCFLSWSLLLLVPCKKLRARHTHTHSWSKHHNGGGSTRINQTYSFTCRIHSLYIYILCLVYVECVVLAARLMLCCCIRVAWVAAQVYPSVLVAIWSERSDYNWEEVASTRRADYTSMYMVYAARAKRKTLNTTTMKARAKARWMTLKWIFVYRDARIGKDI